MKIYTIGFTKRSAEDFFETLRKSGARHLLDIRRHNTSQLAGFTKRDDLRYFLKQVLDIEYHEVKVLAPEEQALKEYQGGKDWTTFEKRFLEALAERKPEKQLDRKVFEEGTVLLCGEVKPDHCHRRLAAEYLQRHLFPDAVITHL